jgi:hypothetical protein
MRTAVLNNLRGRAWAVYGFRHKSLIAVMSLMGLSLGIKDATVS